MLKAQARQAQASADKAGVAAQQAQAQAAQAAPAAPPGKTSHGLLYSSPNVNVTLGGFIEAASMERNHNEVADVGSSFGLGFGNGIPLPDSPNYHASEFRESARQSRLSLLAQGDEDMKSYAAYFELDFLGVGTASNSIESNSYTPRIRHVYATYDAPTDGWHFLGGQTWSLLTLDRVGITPRSEVTPLTIDAQYVTGFSWARQPQLRLVKDFDKKIWVGISAESPEANFFSPTGYGAGGGGAAATGVTGQQSGGSLLNGNNAKYALNQAPDIVGKVAVDPGWGHYEVYGILRNFTDYGNLTANTPGTHTNWGGGGGAAAILPVIPKMLDFQASFLVGNGIGRYGSAQFSDVVADGVSDSPTPIPEVMGLVGLVGHPNSDLDVYGYAGYEGVRATAVSGTTFGLGNPNYNNSNCLVAGSTTNCAANAKDEWQGTIGAWWKFYQGKAGMMEVGAQEAYIHVDTFSGVGGAPKANENIIMGSFRYYPF